MSIAVLLSKYYIWFTFVEFPLNLHIEMCSQWYGLIILLYMAVYTDISHARYLSPLSSVKYHFRTRGAVICFFQQTLSPISRALARKDIRQPIHAHKHCLRPPAHERVHPRAVSERRYNSIPGGTTCLTRYGGRAARTSGGKWDPVKFEFTKLAQSWRNSVARHAGHRAPAR